MIFYLHIQIFQIFSIFRNQEDVLWNSSSIKQGKIIESLLHNKHTLTYRVVQIKVTIRNSYLYIKIMYKINLIGQIVKNVTVFVRRD